MTSLALLSGTSALIARVAASTVSGGPRRAFVLRLSRLPPALARPHHLRLARAAIVPLRQIDRAETYHLPNADTAVLWRGGEERALQASLSAVAELFAGTSAGAGTLDPLCVVLDLPEQAEALLRIAAASRPGGPAAVLPGEARLPLDPAGLAALERDLEGTDIARFTHRRVICAARPDGTFAPAWEARTVAVAELEAELAPGRAVQADPWLFARLARTLDRRVLAAQAKPWDLRDSGPFGIDLSVASILGPEFLRLDTMLPAALRGRVVLGLRAPDILGDLAAFVFARGFAQARGYRLLLAAADPALLGALPPAGLGLDLVQLPWSPGLAETDPERLEIDPARLVLTGADTAQAIAWGRLHGVALYQGRAVVPRPSRTERQGP